jgi:hypothetical protein
VSPVKYELGFYIPEDGILHNHRRGNLKSYRCYVISVQMCKYTADSYFTYPCLPLADNFRHICLHIMLPLRWRSSANGVAFCHGQPTQFSTAYSLHEADIWMSSPACHYGNSNCHDIRNCSTFQLWWCHYCLEMQRLSTRSGLCLSAGR